MAFIGSVADACDAGTGIAGQPTIGRFVAPSAKRMLNSRVPRRAANATTP